jgi:predicted MFS family arabinose efflux permease
MDEQVRDASRLPASVVWRHAASALMAAAASSMMLPLAAATLAERGEPSSSIGLFAALPFLVLLAASPIVGSIRRALGRGRCFRAGIGAAFAQMSLFLFADGLPAWWAAALLGGVSAALVWSLTDALVAENAVPERVGRMTGVYQTLLSAALAAGPALPYAFGLAFDAAAVVGAALVLASLLPIATLPTRSIDGDGRADEPRRAGPLLRTMPWIAAAAAAGGAFETGMNAIGPVYASMLGYGPAEAALVASVIGLGGMAVQYPLGHAADVVPVRALLLSASLLLLLSGAALPFVPAAPSLVWALAAVWGAAGGALYTLVLIRIARDAGRGHVAAAANAALAAYTAGTVLAPLAGGIALQSGGTAGLSALLCALAVAVGTASLARRTDAS